MPAVSPPRERVEPVLDAVLRAEDLADLFGAPEAVWRIHTALVHRAYGVALGLGCRLGSYGQVVLVGPGLAYDAAGRALVSSSPVVVPAPPGTGSFELQAAVDERASCDRRIRLRWVRPGATGDRRGDGPPGLPLARLVRGAGAPDLQDVRPWTRRVARPQIASGTLRGWAAPAGPHWELAVSTAEAGFRAIPIYFASVREKDPVGASRGPFVEIREPTPKGFTAGLRWTGWRTFIEGPPLRIEVCVDWIGVLALGRPEVPMGLDRVVDTRGCPVDVRRQFPLGEEVPV